DVYQTISARNVANRDVVALPRPIYHGRPVSGSDKAREEPIGFWVTRSDDAGGVLLALHGELDVAAAPQLEKLLEKTRAEGHSRVTVELSNLSFVDSAGVSVLIKAKKEAEEGGSEFVLHRPTAQVHRVFALVGMVDWLVFDE